MTVIISHVIGPHRALCIVYIRFYLCFGFKM